LDYIRAWKAKEKAPEGFVPERLLKGREGREWLEDEPAGQDKNKIDIEALLRDLKSGNV
jgi:hypothetical protein